LSRIIKELIDDGLEWQYNLRIIDVACGLQIVFTDIVVYSRMLKNDLWKRFSIYDLILNSKNGSSPFLVHFGIFME
jgi:hypothetical protein